MADIGRPDERAVLTELASPRFELGLALGHWRLISVSWPIVVLEVSAGDGHRFAFRFECVGYPSSRPEVTVWDIGEDTPLPADARPVMLDPYQLVFRTDWEGGQHLYHPMERHAFATHNGWSNDLRFKLWISARGLTQWCHELHGMLNSGAYQPRQADAA
jgi:hypothetical protein